jgi:hypothetical protein
MKNPYTRPSIRHTLTAVVSVPALLLWCIAEAFWAHVILGGKR